MEPTCRTVRKILVESAGDPAVLDQAVLRHLAACPECSREAEVQRRLYRVLEAAVPPADRALQDLVAARAGSGTWERVLPLVPVAAGGLVLAGGALAVGGVPGVGLAAMVPGISLGAGVAAAGGIGGIVNAGTVALQAIHTVVPGVVPLAAGGAAVLGAVLIALGVRRMGRDPA